VREGTMNVSGPSVQETIEIIGMTCTGCARAVENELRKFSGIEYDIDFPERSVTVVYSPAEYNRDDFEKAIESLGYRIKGKSY
jgi:P-type Cu+ transporter